MERTFRVVYKGETLLMNEADLLVIRMQSDHFLKLVNYPHVSPALKHIVANMATELTEIALQAKGGSEL